MIILKIIGIVIVITGLIFFFTKDDDDYFDNMSAMNMGG